MNECVTAKVWTNTTRPKVTLSVSGEDFGAITNQAKRELIFLNVFHLV